MGKDSKIAWTHHTFNPWVGCQKVGPGCDHCYAESWAKRSGMVAFGPSEIRRRTSVANWKQPRKWNGDARIKFESWENMKTVYPGLTDAQLLSMGFVKPERPRVFCASLADVFDNEAPEGWRADLFDLIEHTPYLDWLLLTKRIGNARAMIQRAMWQNGHHQGMNHSLPENVWLGITVVNQMEADRDIPKLLNLPARVRFLSIEPMLGPIRLDKPNPIPSRYDEQLRGIEWIDEATWLWKGWIDWVIVGGESGPKARPMHPDWVRSLRDQCRGAGVPFLFKQWGEWGPNWFIDDASQKIPGSEWMDRIGKASAGRVLDGVIHDEFPGDRA